MLTSVLQTIEVPETLLKKRKQNDKAREDRLVAAAAARKVIMLANYFVSSFYCDAYDTFDFLAKLMMLPKINHLSGLNLL